MGITHIVSTVILFNAVVKMLSTIEALRILRHVCRRCEDDFLYLQREKFWFKLINELPKEWNLEKSKRSIIESHGITFVDDTMEQFCCDKDVGLECVDELKKIIVQYEKYNLDKLNLHLEELKLKLSNALEQIYKYIVNYISGIKGDNNLEVYIKYLSANLFLGDISKVIVIFIRNGGLFNNDGLSGSESNRNYIQCMRLMDNDTAHKKVLVEKFRSLYSPVSGRRGNWNNIDAYFQVSDEMISKDRIVNDLNDTFQDNMHIRLAILNSAVLHYYLQIDPDLSTFQMVYRSWIYPIGYEQIFDQASKVLYFDVVKLERLHVVLKDVFDKFGKSTEHSPDQSQKYLTDFKYASENYFLLYNTRNIKFEGDKILSVCYKILRLHNAIANEIGVDYISEPLWKYNRPYKGQPWEILSYTESDFGLRYNYPPNIFENPIKVENLKIKVEESLKDRTIQKWARKYFEFDIINIYSLLPYDSMWFYA